MNVKNNKNLVNPQYEQFKDLILQLEKVSEENKKEIMDSLCESAHQSVLDFEKEGCPAFSGFAERQFGKWNKIMKLNLQRILVKANQKEIR